MNRAAIKPMAFLEEDGCLVAVGTNWVHVKVGKDIVARFRGDEELTDLRHALDLASGSFWAGDGRDEIVQTRHGVVTIISDARGICLSGTRRTSEGATGILLQLAEWLNWLSRPYSEVCGIHISHAGERVVLAAPSKDLSLELVPRNARHLVGTMLEVAAGADARQAVHGAKGGDRVGLEAGADGRITVTLETGGATYRTLFNRIVLAILALQIDATIPSPAEGHQTIAEGETYGT